MGNAKDKLHSFGYHAKWVQRRTKKHNGIGGATARDKKAFPYLTRLGRLGVTSWGSMAKYSCNGTCRLLEEKR